MLKALIQHIQVYERLNQKGITFNILALIVTRLYQVDVEQLKTIPTEDLQQLITYLLRFQTDSEVKDRLLILADQALAVLERYHTVYPERLVHLEVELGNCISELQRQFYTAPTPKILSAKGAAKRTNDEEVDREISALRFLCQGLQKLETSAQSETVKAQQREKLDIAIGGFCQKQAIYWQSQSSYQSSKQTLKTDVQQALQKGSDVFQKLHDALIHKAQVLQAMGFYEEARDMLAYSGLPAQVPNRSGGYPLASLLAPIIELNEAHLKQLQTQKPAQGFWRKHREELKAMRAIHYTGDIYSYQLQLANTYLSIIRAMLDRAEVLLGPAPRKFCVIAFGSLSRGDVHGHSDVEAGLIVQNTKDKNLLEYLQNFLQLWQYEMEALGESDATQGGFHFDTGGVSIAFKQGEAQTNFVYDVAGYVRESICRFAEDNTQLRPLFLFGDEELFQESQAALPSLARTQLKPILQRTAKILAQSTTLISPTSQQLKENYLHPLIWAITQLGLHYGLPKTVSSHPIAILNALREQNILDERFVQDCAQALTRLYEQRINSSTNLTAFLQNIDTVTKPLSLLLKWLSQDKPRILSQPIHPGYYPDMNGQRYLVERELREWQSQVKQHYLSPSKPEDGPGIRVQTLQCGDGWLPKTVVNELIQGSWISAIGQLNLAAKETSKIRGRHLVIPLLNGPCPIYLKVFPEMPGMEYSASCFNRLLVGHGLPFVDIARLDISGVLYPVLLSQAIKGPSLEEALQAGESHIPLTLRQFSEAFITALFLNQEDGKHDNYRVKLERQGTTSIMSLYSIDNDRSFYPAAIEEQEGKFTLINKTIVYCFAEMKEPLAPSLSQELLSLEPYLLLQTWLQELNTLEINLRKLFTEQEIKGIFQGDLLTQMLKRSNIKSNQPPENSLLLVPIREHLVSELYHKFLRLQAVLSASINMKETDRLLDDESESTTETAKTCLDLLKVLEPISGYYYEQFLNEGDTVIVRFSAGPGKYYGRSQKDSYFTQKSMPETLNTLQGKPIKVEALLKRDREYFIKNAIQELAATRGAHQKLQSIKEAIMRGEVFALQELEAMTLDSLKERVINQLDFKAMRTPFLVLFKVMGKICFIRLRLVRCPISMSQLKNIFKKSPFLKELTLKDIPSIDVKLWSLLSQYCQHLEKLHLDNLVNLRIENAARNTKFEILEYLSIKNCHEMAKVELDAPKLWGLRIEQADKLNQIGITNNTNLSLLKLKRCGELTKVELDAPKLWGLRIEQADKLNQISITNSTNLSLLKLKRCGELTINNIREIVKTQMVGCEIEIENCEKLKDFGRIAADIGFFAKPGTEQVENSTALIRLYYPEVSELLKGVAESDLSKVEKLLNNNRSLTLAQGDITDSFGRAFKNITAFQLAVWYLDNEMWEIILEYFLNKQQAMAQLNALENDRKDITNKYGLHFDLDPFINSCETSYENFDRWDGSERDKHLQIVEQEVVRVAAWVWPDVKSDDPVIYMDSRQRSDKGIRSEVRSLQRVVFELKHYRAPPYHSYRVDHDYRTSLDRETLIGVIHEDDRKVGGVDRVLWLHLHRGRLWELRVLGTKFRAHNLEKLAGLKVSLLGSNSTLGLKQ